MKNHTMNHDIANLLKHALTVIGCDAAKIGAIDSHSAIELSFKETPSFLVSNDGAGVLFRATVAKVMEDVVLTYAYGLLKFLLEPASWTLSGQVQLIFKDGQVDLQSHVKPATLETPEAFADALTDFYDRVKRCHKIFSA